MNKVLLLLFLALNILPIFGQDAATTKTVRKLLKAKMVIWDKYNEDGVLIAQSKKTKRWRMYQYAYDGKRPKTLVSSSYDSLGFYSHSTSYTIVKNHEKYGILDSPWGVKRPRLLVRCMYKMLKYSEGYNVMAAKGKNNLWGYIDVKSGDTLIPFVYSNYNGLPKASRRMHKYPMREYPPQIMQIINDPESITELKLRGLKLTSLPDEIRNCKNVKSVDLQNNMLTELPDAFFELTQIESLLLGSNPYMSKFDARFGKLVNLKELYIGALKGSGTMRSTSDYLEFSSEMSKMQSLEILSLGQHFNAYSNMPEFIYGLPNLTYLSLNTLFVREFENLDLKRMKSRASIKTLYLYYLSSFKDLKEGMKYFTSLELLSVGTHTHKDPINWLYDLDSIKALYIRYYKDPSEGESYYDEALNISERGDIYDTVPIDKKQKEKIIAEWDSFIDELKGE